MQLKQRYNPQTVGTLVEDVSPHDVIRRFKKLHELRLARIQRFVKLKQQIFLDLLPLLFHENIPLLPGFTAADTPSGIANYMPEVHSLKAAKKFSHSYSYKPQRLVQLPIEAIFLMGSVSSIAFSDHSDMDIWVCYDPTLTAAARDALKAKADAIEKWSISLGLEVHFFLIDSVQFLQGQSTPISSESSGRMQHYLLLEEFYRTAIYVAGKVPAWWLVPPHAEHEYQNHIEFLLKNRFVQAQDIIDLGGLDKVPPEEFISATFWHLYKALYAPHKSLLKLLLMECYASEYPHSDWLCLHLKQAIYEGIVDIDDLDPYLMIYRKIDRYLQGYPQRLLFARQCFYLKVMGGVASSGSGAFLQAKMTETQRLRYEFIQQVADDWRWPRHLIPELMDNKLWTISKASWEYEVIQDQLQQSYRIIQGFTKRYSEGIADHDDLELIRRKLRSYLSPKPGKVDIITNQSSVRLPEEAVTLLESVTPYGDSSWLLYSGKIDPLAQLDEQPIKRTGSYLEILVWLVVNGVYHKQLTIHVEADAINLSTLDIQRICEQIQQFLQGRIDTSPQNLDIYRSIDARLGSLAFSNLNHQEIGERQDGKLMISQQSDALSYGSQQACLLKSIDSVSLSRWGEISINHYLGISGLFDYLVDTLNALEKPLNAKQFQLACYVPVRGNTILLRLNNLVQQLSEVFEWLHPNQAVRYLLAVGASYYCIQYQDQAFTYWEIPSKLQLFNELGRPQGMVMQTVFDPEIKLKSVIPTLYAQKQAGVIQIFYLSNGADSHIYLLDEKGALYMQKHPQANIEHVLNSYAVFLDAVIEHYFADRRLRVLYYEIQQSSVSGLSCKPVTLRNISPYQKLDIRISAVLNEEKAIRYAIYCNERVFSSLDYGKAVFSAAASHIFKMRRGNEQYPIRISDVDVPLALLGVSNIAQLHSIHLLQFKQKIEARLNV